MSPGQERDAQLSRIGIPARPFLFTLDQVADMLMLDLPNFKQNHCYFEGRSTLIYTQSRLMCRNIAAAEKTPDWRITEKALIRWMRYKGYRYYTRGYVE